MSNVVELDQRPLAIIYDRAKFFYLKRLVNSFVTANPHLRPLQKQLDAAFKLHRDKQARLLIIYNLMNETMDPIIINLLGMNQDIVRYQSE